MDGKVTLMNQDHGFQEFGRISEGIDLVHFFFECQRRSTKGYVLKLGACQGSK